MLEEDDKTFLVWSDCLNPPLFSVVITKGLTVLGFGLNPAKFK
jgi:hypothetical protein